MASIFQDSRIAKYVLSSLWLRMPFIICSEDSEKNHQLAAQILGCTPEYRQLIVCGDVPRSITYSMRKPRILDSSNIELLKQSLFESFEEEAPGIRPIQLVCFECTVEILEAAFSQLDRGWFITTEMSASEVMSRVEVAHSEQIEDLTICFLKKETNFQLEEALLEKSRNRPDEITPFVFQLKMSEINLVGAAILKELESGNSLTQVEIQELFHIDEPTLMRTMQLLKHESNTNVEPYIKMTPDAVKNKLSQIIEISGVFICGAVESGNLIGLATSRELKVSPVNLFPELAGVFTQLLKKYNFGDSPNLAIEYKNGKKILLTANGKYTYGLISDATVNVDLLQDRLSNLL